MPRRRKRRPRAAAEHEALAAQHRADAAQAAEAKRQLRVPMFAYWQAASSALDKATHDADDGATAIQNEDLVSASSAYSSCASDADDAKSQSLSNVPDGWNDVSGAFLMAAGKLEDACKSAVAAVDDQRPSEIAAAESSMNDFKTYQILAAGKALELWLAAGGDPKSL